MKALLRDTLILITIAAVIVAGQRAIVMKIVVDGPSMNYTLHDGQQIVVNKVVYKLHEPERGDVIVFYSTNNSKEEYIKRIIGLPGELVEINDGVVHVHKNNGSVLRLTEPYVTNPARISFEGAIIPKDKYFVLGDNRNNSSDSRSGWTVLSRNIIGKAWLSVLPPERRELLVKYLSIEK